MKNSQHKALREDPQFKQKIEKTKKARKLEQDAEEAKEEIEIYKRNLDESYNCGK